MHSPVTNTEPQPLRALVLGSGYAGQGHALALRQAGVVLAGMASRTADIGSRIASDMEIPHYSTDWRQLLADLRPDIVAVGTPGGTHVEMITAAIEANCHVLSDKPLATTAADAIALAQLARQRGVKTAFAASFWYQPQACLVRRLIQQGVIGRVLEMEGVSHFHWSPLMPFGWPHRLATGGGRLNNNFPHKLAIALHVLAGEVLAVQGESRQDLQRAPIGPPVHDFRDFAKQALDPATAAAGEWADVDSDWSYTALLRIGDPARRLGEAVSVTFRHSARTRGKFGDYMAIYGEAGTLHVDGTFMQGTVWLGRGREEWEAVPLPEDLQETLAAEPDHTQRNWNLLAQDFVADIRGASPQRYLTFEDGALFQAVIETIRNNQCWVRPNLPQA